MCGQEADSPSLGGVALRGSWSLAIVITRCAASLASSCQHCCGCEWVDSDCDFAQVDQTPVVPTSTAARRATIASLSETLPGDQSPNTKWSSLESSRPLRLGSSAPVCIPHSGHLRLRTHEGLSEVEEEEQDQPKATTFVPPHLMVDKPAIQFSLHGSTAEKKAKLRARNTILQMTGFLEPAKSEDKAWNHGTERAIKAPGALAREFGASKCEPLESEQG
ncbi:unnamed protein product [Ostreobium quekettii]|uniref:Uncharacterized protein n=1 Tax=Ostreobium quekettii TaxID=121088 RepID=A0A8S1IMZ1_9CHLO|nr:unnamed protein product [Ostreobium quekettii]